ncbi:hypothetical protein GCM10023170_064960 [Phytohabitans houttuyneae]|uniref:Lecithin:cholesterol acyltransferase n=1 Tax=Phytohabitans houttuyneae TaxID=1076126 RepID=A0A6V8KJE4_9ACTN|nr:hypothetical protein Phou_060070 [Phytohabitans houttuyneae]
MGSELRDAADRVVWGLRPSLLVEALGSTAGRRRLLHTLADVDTPLAAVRPMTVAAGLPRLGTVESNVPILRRLRREAVREPDAFVAFPYDWRQPVEAVASRFADFAEAHLRRWRRNPLGGPEAMLSLVCHSMGGLVAQHFVDVLGGRDSVRTTITLGTPFYGSIRAVTAIAEGPAAPFGGMRRTMRDLARAFPSIYDLLPRYRCVVAGDGLRALTVADVASVGGDAGLAEAANARHARAAAARAKAGPGGLRARVGLAQPTAQTVRFDSGAAYPLFHHGGEDRGGDGTVARDAAAPAGAQPHYVPQKHARLATTAEAFEFVRAVLTERPLGEPLGDGFGVDLPEVVRPGEPFEVIVRLPPGVPATCVVTDTETERQVAVVEPRPRDGWQVAAVTLPSPGLYRADVKAGGFSAVGDLVLAIADLD